jgi:hypothetical protein
MPPPRLEVNRQMTNITTAINEMQYVYACLTLFRNWKAHRMNLQRI